MRKLVRVVLLVLVVLAGARAASAATLTWEGDVGPNWNDGVVFVNTNWTDGVNQVKPQDGDVLIFPAGGLNPSSTNNDIVGLDLAAIQINGIGAGNLRYFLLGQPITLNSAAGLLFNAPAQGGSGPSVQLGITLNTSLSITSTPISIGQSFLGDINLNGFTLTFDLNAGRFFVDNIYLIAGAGEIIKTGAGSLAFDGNNTYTGVTRILGGYLEARSNGSLGAVGPGNETIVTDGGSLELRGSATIGESLIIRGVGVGDVNQARGAIFASDLNTTNTLTGPITIADDATIYAGAHSPAGFTISGPISGDAGADLTLNGAGPLFFTGTNTYSGTTIVQVALYVNGTQPLSPIVLNNGTIGGIGTVGTITDIGVTQFISPGMASGTTGVLSSGSVTLSDDVLFTPQLNGNVVGADYDQLSVTGTVNLNGAHLFNVSLGFVPTTATSFIIINNDASDPVIGAFDDLGEGATFLIGTTPATITYQGGDGNDVVLSVGPFLSHFAEGATFTNDGLDFEVELAVLNPGALDADVTLRFLKTDGTTVATPLVVPTMSLRTVTVSPIAGLENAEFSTAIEANVPVTVERTMTWVGSGSGAHAETAINAPALEWYLAEGATHSGFSLFYLIANANLAAASIDVTYLLPSPAPPLTKNYVVPGNTRSTIWVNVEDTVLAATDVSAVVRSLNNVPVVVERAMYLDRPNEKFVAGHASAGLAAPALTWHLAEGATGPFFDSFVLLANPTLLDATVTVRYLGPLGQIVTRNYLVDAQSRRTVWVDFDHPLLADTAFAATVTSDVPILVERAMWWPEPHEARYEAHNSAGVTALSTRWTVADASSGGVNDAETYLLIGNSSASAATVQVTLVFEDGTGPAQKTYAVLPASRFNVSIVDEFPAAVGKRVAAIVESLPPNANTAATPLVVERSTYIDGGGVVWENGVNTLGTRPR